MTGASRARTSTITRNGSSRADALLYGLAAIISALLGAISHDVIGRSLRIPLSYKGDSLFYGAAFKGTLDNGWYETNPYLNAPVGQSQHDFPQADNLQYVFAKLFDVFTDDWVVAFNVTYLLTFPLAAMAGAWFFRLVGCSRTSSLVMACLFAIAPYHFFHGISHLALSMYFVLPLGVGLCFLAFTDRPVLTRREVGSWKSPLTWATRRNAAVVAVLVLLGSTSSYYSVFTLMLFAGTVLVLLLRRHWRPAVSSVSVMGGLVAVMLVNMAPDLWYARTDSTNLVSFERLPIESEIFATKLSWLVLPTHWNRVGSLGEWRLEQDGTFPLPGEPTALGVVAAFGFLVLLLLPVMRIALRRAPTLAPVTTSSRPVSTYDALGALSVFNLAAFLFATVGGVRDAVRPSGDAFHPLVVQAGDPPRPAGAGGRGPGARFRHPSAPGPRVRPGSARGSAERRWPCRRSRARGRALRPAAERRLDRIARRRARAVPQRCGLRRATWRTACPRVGSCSSCPTWPSPRANRSTTSPTTTR